MFTNALALALAKRKCPHSVFIVFCQPLVFKELYQSGLSPIRMPTYTFSLFRKRLEHLGMDMQTVGDDDDDRLYANSRTLIIFLITFLINPQHEL